MNHLNHVNNPVQDDFQMKLSIQKLAIALDIS